tara:strand:- start:585 stop:935 length:351 start_codon:yes stop_codon:yes gene_type:complete
MSHLDKDIFSKKKYSDLLQEIYNNQKKKENQITALISELKPLIQDIGDATLVVPLIKEYMELGIKNDEALIKIAAIIQRIFQTDSSGGEDFAISDEEKEQLLKEINKLKPPTKKSE